MTNRTIATAEPLAPISAADLPLARMYRAERERPDDVFLVQPIGNGRVREYTFAAVMKQARRLAGYLHRQSLPAGSHIALITKNCAHHFIFDLATWMAGHVSVSIYPTIGRSTLRYILEHCRAKMLFVGKVDDWDELAPAVPEGVELLTCELSPPIAHATRWSAVLAETSELSGNPERDGDDTATLLYTSGSTGRPKGVAQSFNALQVFCAGVCPVLQLGASDRMVSYLPLAHVFERMAVEIPALHYGYRVYFVDSLDTFLDDVKRARPTIFQSVPRLWIKLKAGVEAKLPAHKLDRLLRMPLIGRLVRKKVLAGLGLDHARLGYTGSAPIPAEVLAWFQRLGLELIEGYGMTESGLSTFSRPGQTVPGAVGSPAPGVSVRIADDGEVQVKGPNTMQGYFRDPERTRAAFTDDGWLRTGDRGQLDDAGYLRLTGRVKELFKTSKGKYVAPAPIENTLNCTEHIEQSCVMGRGLAQPFAVVMLCEDALHRLNNGARAELLRSLTRVLDDVNAGLERHERLAGLIVSRDTWHIADGMLTPSMKIKRDAIEARYESFADEARFANARIVVEPAGDRVRPKLAV